MNSHIVPKKCGSILIRLLHTVSKFLVSYDFQEFAYDFSRVRAIIKVRFSCILYSLG